MLIGLVASCVASGFVTNDELKAQLLSEYRLLTTHPAAAAAQLGLDENGQQTVNQLWCSRGAWAPAALRLRRLLGSRAEPDSR